MTFTNAKLSYILDPHSAEEIRNTSLRLLERVGFQIGDLSIRELLHDAGASVEGERVFIPAKVVIDALQKAPKVVNLYSRDGRVISSVDGCNYHSPAPSAINILEYGGGRRLSSYKDVVDLTRLEDALSGLDFISAPAIAQDCPGSQSGLLTAEATFCNTQKFCLVFALNMEEAQAWVDMAEHAAGGMQELLAKPTIGFAISPTSPLVLAKTTSDILTMAAKIGLPIVTAPGGMAGGTDPYTQAGTLALEHAESLLVITITQLLHPGTPCILGLATAVMDMASSNISLGMVERTMILNSVVSLSQVWEMPSYAPAGLSDSFSLDMQAGAEKMLSYFTQFMSGIEFSGGAGRFEGGLSTSFEGVLLDHEILQQVRRYLKGIRVDAETLAEEAIARVGPAGNFLEDELTLKLLRSGEYVPAPLFNRRSQNTGGRTSIELAHEKAKEILSTHPSSVPESLQKEYRSIIAGHLAIME